MHGNPHSLVAALVVLLLVLTACAGDDRDTAADGQGDTATPATEQIEETDDAGDDDTADAGDDDGATAGEGGVAAGTYDIGLIAAEQGNIAFAGVSYAEGAELAMEEINEQGYLGDGAELTLVKEEGSEDQATTIQVFNQFRSRDSVLGVICCILSPVAGAVKPLAIENEVPLVIYGATLPGLPEPPLVYRTAIPPFAQLSTLSQAAVDELGPESYVAFVTADNEGMVAQLESFREPLDEAGVEPLATIQTQAADTDFSGPATQAISHDPDLIIVSAIGEPSGGIIKALRDRGYEGHILANSTVAPDDVFSIAGDALVGVPYPLDYAPISEVRRAQDFTAAYEERWSKSPDTYSAQGYDAVWFMAEGVLEAATLAGDGVPTRETLSQGLEAVESREDSVFGTVTYEEGQAVAEAIILATRNADGEVVLWEPGDA